VLVVRESREALDTARAAAWPTVEVRPRAWPVDPVDPVDPVEVDGVWTVDVGADFSRESGRGACGRRRGVRVPCYGRLA